MLRRNKLTIISLVAVATAVVAPFAVAQKKAKVITVSILRVAQIDNLDKGDMLKADRADFYAWVKIGNGKLTRSGNHSDDDGHPGWKFYGEGSGRYVPIRIKINDDDGGIEEQDDYVDVCRKKGKKDLSLVYDTVNGRISGDVTGRRGQVLYSEGGGDNDKGKIWFSIK